PTPNAVPRITNPDSMVRRKVSQPCDDVLDDAGRYWSGVETEPLPDAPWADWFPVAGAPDGPAAPSPGAAPPASGVVGLPEPSPPVSGSATHLRLPRLPTRRCPARHPRS